MPFPPISCHQMARSFTISLQPQKCGIDQLRWSPPRSSRPTASSVYTRWDPNDLTLVRKTFLTVVGRKCLRKMTWGFQTCGPNEALVVSGFKQYFFEVSFNWCIPGCCHTKPLLVPGGRAFVWPGIQYIQRYLHFWWFLKLLQINIL